MINSLPVTIEQQTQMFSEGPAGPTENGVDSGESPKRSAEGATQVLPAESLRQKDREECVWIKAVLLSLCGRRAFFSVERKLCRNVSVRSGELRLRNTVLGVRDRIYGRIERTCCKGR